MPPPGHPAHPGMGWLYGPGALGSGFGPDRSAGPPPDPMPDDLAGAVAWVKDRRKADESAPPASSEFDWFRGLIQDFLAYDLEPPAVQWRTVLEYHLSRPPRLRRPRPDDDPTGKGREAGTDRVEDALYRQIARLWDGRAWTIGSAVDRDREFRKRGAVERRWSLLLFDDGTGALLRDTPYGLVAFSRDDRWVEPGVDASLLDLAQGSDEVLGAEPLRQITTAFGPDRVTQRLAEIVADSHKP